RPAPRAVLERRTVPGAVGPLLRRVDPASDLVHVLASRLRFPRRLVEPLLPWGIGRFQRKIAARLSEYAPQFVIGYEGSALTIFTAAARAGIPCLLDMAHPHPRASLHWMQRAHGEWPDWSGSDDSPFLDPASVSKIDAEVGL